MYVIEVEDKYYVEQVIIGSVDNKTADVVLSEDIDYAHLFDGVDGVFVMYFLQCCEGNTKFRYVQVEYDG